MNFTRGGNRSEFEFASLQFLNWVNGIEWNYALKENE